MGAEAYDTLSDKLASEDSKNLAYKNLIDQLQQYYNLAPLEIAKNFRFHQRKQHAGENVHEFLVALQKVAVNCKCYWKLKI